MIKKLSIRFMLLLSSLSGLLQAGDYNCETTTTSDPCYAQMACCEEPSGHFFIRGDLLYWKPHISGSELAFETGYITESVVDGVQIINGQEFDKDSHLKWGPGYRIAGGYQFGNNLEIGVYWTHFQDNGTRNGRQNINTVNTGKINLKFDQIDLVLAYNAKLNDRFLLKPFIGVRGAKIHEHLDAIVVTDVIPPSLVPGTVTRFFDDKQNFRGIGPVFGFQADWMIGCGFSLYGTAAASVLYGEYKVHLDDLGVITVPPPRQIFTGNRRDLHEFTWNADLALGISWQKWICNLFELTLKLGIEHHQYFDHNHLSVHHGDLCFDGAIFSLNIAL